MSALRALNSVTENIQRVGVFRGLKSGMVRNLLVVLGGLIGIQLLVLVITNINTESTYKILHLQNEREVLNTESEVIGTKVNSLSSNQNLVDVAHNLGMVSNVNPVFLRLSDGKIIGKPRRALASQRSVAKNLVPNAAMNTNTNIDQLSGKNGSNVLVSSEEASVSNSTGTIQASPTY